MARAADEEQDVFTDDELSPRRTIRREVNPVFDRKDSLVRGDLILVDVSGYAFGGGERWCVFVFDSPGSASIFPYKAQIPDLGAVGQWKASEIRAWARPVELHRRLTELAHAGRT